MVAPAPGVWWVQYSLNYSTNTLNNSQGNSIDSVMVGNEQVSIDPDVNAYATTAVLQWVPGNKLFGADYAFIIAPNLTRNSVAASLSTTNMTLEKNIDETGLGDLLIQPAMLTWRGARYDTTLGLGFYAPVGEYEADANDNIGLGFWTTFLQGAGYYYFDDAHTSGLMVNTVYETHGKKEGTNITPGDHLLVEYGYSKVLMNNRLELGVAGYSQWQVEKDRGTTGFLEPSKGEVHALGFQAAYWVTPRLNISLKYMNEYDAKSRFEGDWLMLNFIYSPVGLFSFQV